MVTLPEDGELRMGPVALPAGRRIFAMARPEPVAWATVAEVPGAGLVWAALSRSHEQTGLVPFLLEGLDNTTARPWESGELGGSADISELDHLDAASVLKGLWAGKTHVGHPREWDRDQDPETVALIETEIRPFSRQFPGLAPAADEPLDPATVAGVLAALPAARIGLVPAARPADVLPLIGWFASDQFDDALPVAAVLRSWEDRFGATLLQVGFSKIRLLVRRPPRTAEAAQRIAAEQYAFSSERHHALSDDNIPGITAGLAGTPIWTFWWD
jgi:Domain of unknown function (DUF4253)